MNKAVYCIEKEEGYEAYFYGNEIDDCPYQSNPDRQEWINGWLEACEANENIIWMEKPLKRAS